MSDRDNRVEVKAVGPLQNTLSARGPRIYCGNLELSSREERAKSGNALTTESAANALIITRRLAFPDSADTPAGGKPDVPVRGWAVAERLGQDTPLLAAASARRTVLLRAERSRGRHVARLTLTPEWRLVVGLGDQFGAHEFGLSLHGTYGWPVLPGSGLKGLAAAAALDAGADRELVHAVLGGPRHTVQEKDGARVAVREAGDDQRGTVRFLDALPAGAPVTVHDDVITPHQQPYYSETMPGAKHPEPRPPAEHHQPVPVPFVSVSGCFHLDLVASRAEHLEHAVGWLTAAGENLGLGGRTSAGYGYFTCQRATGEDL